MKTFLQLAAACARAGVAAPSADEVLRSMRLGATLTSIARGLGIGAADAPGTSGDRDDDDDDDDEEEEEEEATDPPENVKPKKKSKKAARKAKEKSIAASDARIESARSSAVRTIKRAERNAEHAEAVQPHLNAIVARSANLEHVDTRRLHVAEKGSADAIAQAMGFVNAEAMAEASEAGERQRERAARDDRAHRGITTGGR